MTGQEALEKLIKGNQRFIQGNSIHPHQDIKWRKSLTTLQRPFAIIVGCSDSRVPVEIIFDQGLGDLFVIRVAGQVVSQNELASILYAASLTSTALILVLGHEKCAAITAALAPKMERQKQPLQIQHLFSQIDPALETLDINLDLETKVQKGVEKNVEWIINGLEKNQILAEYVAQKKLLIKGAIYELNSGAVRLLDKM